VLTRQGTLCFAVVMMHEWDGPHHSSNGVSMSPVSSFTDPTEVSVLKAVLILESVAEESVLSDVSEPYQTQRRRQRLALPPPESDNCCRQHSRVGEVVQMCSEAGAAKVANHDYVRQQKRKRHEPPGFTSGRICHEGSNQQHGTFRSQPSAWPSNDAIGFDGFQTVRRPAPLFGI
jgi:hypothetical protein